MAQTEIANDRAQPRRMGSGAVQGRPLPVSAALDSLSNIDSARMGKVFLLSSLVYLGIYALEAPIRYGLYLSGKDDFILLRDALILVPLALLVSAQAMRLHLHPAFALFGALIAFHGLVLMGTIGSVAGVAYGVKVLVNLLFGYFVASLLLRPGDRVFAFLLAVWLITMVGIGLDKFVLTFPWTGIKTVVGDLNVDVSKNWDVQNEFARRVAGFTRSSISVAALVPPLAIVLLARIQRWLWRAALLLVSVGAVLLTTQKGALVAFLPIAAILLFPAAHRLRWLRLSCAGFMIAAVGLPFLIMDLHMEHGSGVFSTASLYLRMDYTWPEAWRWITRHQMLFFGVGLGGIGGPQRLYAIDSFNPADNIFILLYAYFGVFALFYLTAILWLVFRPISGSQERAATAVAIIAFVFGYGTVLSVLEDQAAALFLGAALGALVCETRGRIDMPLRASRMAALR
jgi:hypothetical protein